MQKDIIYIDVEDDITAVIGKVKAATHKIVAVVPPKHVGMLQSAVNLRLLARVAEQQGKRLVLITGNAALRGLAASAAIPVAKTLQSKPEIPEAVTIDTNDDDEIIDGAALPIGEHAASVDSAAKAIAAKDAAAQSVIAAGAVGAAGVAAKKPRSTPMVPLVKGPIKVPDFSNFRNKLGLLIGGGVLLLALLVWAIVFAPTARIIVTARTSNVPITAKVTLAPDSKTDQAAGTLQSTVKQIKKDLSIPYAATGTKDIGDQATGRVSFSTDSIGKLGYTIPAGTTVTANTGATFTTDANVTFSISNYRDNSVTVTATDRGTKSNGVTGSVTGLPAGVYGKFTAATAGGTDKTVPVTTAGDIQAARDKAASQNSDADMKKQLTEQFGGDYVVIDTSYNADLGGLTASPAVDQQAPEGKGTLTGTATYTLVAVSRAEIGKFTDAVLAAQLKGKPNQRVYDNGAKEANFTGVTGDKTKTTANLAANAQVGPQIDDSALKEYAKGKRYGDIQSYVNAVQGVDSTDIKFSPFWVSSAPNDTKRITVEFKLNAK